MKNLIILLLTFTLLFCTGCWSKSEMNELAIIMTIGIDKGMEKDYLISFKIAKPAGAKTEKSTSFQATQHLIFSFEATNISEAAEKLYKVIDKSPFFGQTRLIIISDEVAKGGLCDILDYLSRHYRLRRNVNLLIGKEKVYKLLNTKMSGSELSALNLTARINSSNRNTLTENITIGNFLSKLASGKAQPVIPGERLLTQEDSDIRFPEKQEEVSVEDLAVFKGDRMVGWLSKQETEGYMFTTGKAKRSTITVPLSDSTKVELNFIEQSISKKVEVQDGQPVIKLKFTGDANVLEVNAPAGAFGSPKEWGNKNKDIESKATEAIKEHIESAVKSSKSLNSDIFGFGQTIFRDKPDLWREIEPHWDEIFQDLKVSVDAEVTLKRAGASTSPPYESKEERNLPVVE